MAKSLSTLAHDRLFGAALVAAPLFWLVLILVFDQPAGWFFTGLTFLLLQVLVYPVLEEIVFRGALQGWLYARSPMDRSVAGFSLANVITNTVFAVLHLFSHSLMHATLVLFPSLIFGFFRDRYRSIVPGTLLHVGYNLGAVCLFSG